MSDVNNASSADGGENAISSGDLDFDAAASAWGEYSTESDDEDEGQGQDVEANQASEQPEGTDDDGSDADEGEPEEPAGDEGDEDQPENENENENENEDDDTRDLDSLHGNTKIRLRDGTEWTAGELKRRIDDLRTLDQNRQSFQTERQEFNARQSQLQQRAQAFEQIAPRALAALKASLPEIPDAPKWDPNDPYGYMQEKAAYDDAVASYNDKVQQIQQIEGEQQALHRQREQEAQQNQSQFLEQSRAKLLELMPELRDEGKRETFARDFVSYGQNTYGFSEEELNGAYDPRLMLMAKDAIQYRKMMANKPKPSTQPKKPGAPVAQPGRRESGREANARKSDSVRQRMNKPGGLNMDEAASLLQDLESG